VEPKISFLDNAEGMVKPEIQRLKAHGKHSKDFRRLVLALFEIKIRRCHLEKAATLITEVLDIYQNLAEPDIIDRLGHFRGIIARARISPLSEAEERWKEALHWNRRYNPIFVALILLFVVVVVALLFALILRILHGQFGRRDQGPKLFDVESLRHHSGTERLSPLFLS
jgi:hypothetical protein